MHKHSWWHALWQRWTINSSQYSNACKYDNIFILASLHDDVISFLGSVKITNFQSSNHFLFKCLLGGGYVSCVPSNNVFNMFQNQWSNGKKHQNISYTTFFKLVEYKDCNSLTHKRQAWWPFVWNPILNTHPNKPNLNIQHIFWCTMKIYFIRFGYMIKYQCKLFSFHVWNIMFMDSKQLNPIPSISTRSK